MPLTPGSDKVKTGSHPFVDAERRQVGSNWQLLPVLWSSRFLPRNLTPACYWLRLIRLTLHRLLMDPLFRASLTRKAKPTEYGRISWGDLNTWIQPDLTRSLTSWEGSACYLSPDSFGFFHLWSEGSQKALSLLLSLGQEQQPELGQSKHDHSYSLAYKEARVGGHNHSFLEIFQASKCSGKRLRSKHHQIRENICCQCSWPTTTGFHRVDGISQSFRHKSLADTRPRERERE